MSTKVFEPVYKCFLVVETGNIVKTVGCGYKECTDEMCAKYVREEKEWKRVDTGEVQVGQPSVFGIGAMWLAPGYIKGCWHNETELHLHVLTPGGEWDVDSRASNCGKKDDMLHRCWIRHGVPPLVTVDKNGLTCNAGAGSIQCGSYHGFLVNGELRLNR